MSENTQEILDLLIELWNTGKLDLATRLYSSQADRSDPNQPEPAHGPQQIANYVAEVRAGFPDFNLEIKQRIGEGGLVASEWTCTGTHNGEFQGIPPSGKRIEINGMTLHRIQGGQIVKEQVYFDRLSLLQQLGVAPGAAQSRSTSVGR